MVVPISACPIQACTSESGNAWTARVPKLCRNPWNFTDRSPTAAHTNAAVSIRRLNGCG